jgi:hypothetical protein
MKQQVVSSKRLTKQILSQHNKKEREKTQIKKIKDEKEYITTNTNKIQKIIRE